MDIDPEATRRGLLRRRTPPRGPVVVRAAFRRGRPAVEIVDREQDPRRRPNLLAMSVGLSEAVAVSLDGGGRAVRVWNAERDSAGSSLDARLLSLESAPAEPRPISHGVREGVVGAATCVAFDLPDGPNLIRLVLDRHTVAALSDEEGVRSVHGGVGEAVAERISTGASRLTLMSSVAGRDGYFRLELVEAGPGDELVVRRGRPFERRMSSSGLVRLRIEPSASRGEGLFTSRARGPVEEAMLLGADGVACEGDCPVPPEGGVLLLRHGEGKVLVWLDAPGEHGEGLIDEPRAEARTIPVPSSKPLFGKSVTLRVEAARDAPVMLHLRAAQPMALRIDGPGMEPRVAIHSSGLAEDAYLPGGAARVALRALGDGALSGSLSVTSTGVLPAREGLSQSVLLGPGEARAFSFEVERPGPVGVGVQAESDDIEAFVLDASGEPVPGIEAGFVVAMPHLDAGRYVLVIRAASSARPLLARPALAGIEPPDTGPPDEVVRRYLGAVGR